MRIHQIVSQLASCRQEGQSVIDYYGRLVNLWDELQRYRQLPACTCGAAAKIAKEREDEKVHQFVMGLDESRFGNVICHIVDADPMPDLAQAYSKAIREEQRLTAKKREQQYDAVGFVVRRDSQKSDLSTPFVKNEAGEASGFATRSGAPNFSGGNKNRERALLCSHCGRSRHEKDFCWEIIGYPDWWSERNKGGRGGSSSGRGGRGGRGTNSNLGGRGRSYATVAHATSPHASAFPSFTSEQWEAIKKMASEKTSDKLSGKIFSGKITEDMILDTGASHHMTGNIELLVDIKSTPSCSVGFADGSTTVSKSMGVLHVSDRITLVDVLYVPDLNCSLISVSKLLKQLGCVAMFTDTVCVLQDRFSWNLIGAGKERDEVYYLMDEAAVRVNKVTVDCDSALWHRRLGHPAFSVLSNLPTSLGNLNSASPSPCDICFRAKQTREVFFYSFNKAADCFSLIHVDVWGPYRVSASCGAKYFLTIVDDFSRAVWTHLLLEKSEVRQVLQNFCAYAEKQFDKPVRVVRSDNGTEFMCLTSFFKSKGIVHQTSCVDTPQQNGRVERKHRHILNIARSLLFQASLPVSFWGEAILTAAYLINRTPTKVLQDRTPYELLHGETPSYEYIKVFGSSCYTHKRSRDKDKFGERSRRCIFVGYPFGKKGWKVYDLEREEFLVSRDVIFQEEEFPFACKTSDTQFVCETQFDATDDWLPNFVPRCAETEPPLVADEEEHSVEQSLSITNDYTTISDESPPPKTTETTLIVPDVDLLISRDLEKSPSNDTNDPTCVVLSVDEQVAGSVQNETELDQGKRERFPSVRLKGYVTYTARSIEDPHHVSPVFTPVSSSTVQGTQTPYPLTNYISDDMFSSTHRAFLAAVIEGVEPTSYKQAMQDPRWTNAMGSEIGAMEENHTWSIVDLPHGKEAINSQWVYKIKYNADGSIERYKARLVACGNRQVEGEDYYETFAPVVKMSTVRGLLRYVAAKNWEAHQMDVHNAFLHGDLEEKVYMKLPVGFRHSSPNKVCRLHKSLYGLKQASRCWFAKLTSALTKFGFVQSYADYSLFMYSRGDVELRVLIYVDVLLVCGNNSRMLQSFKAYLGRCFHMKDLGKAKYFLGIEIARASEGIYLSQRKYSMDLVTEAGLLGSKPAATPIEQNHRLSLSKSAFLPNPAVYRRLVGRLIYLLSTRPDLCYSVNLLSQFMKTPRVDHLEAAYRVVRFLKGSPGRGILLSSDPDLTLTAYCDSDWNSCPITRRSLSGYVTFVGGSPILWRTKKQDTVSHSSAEAEYRSMRNALCEVQWLKKLLPDLGCPAAAPVRLFCDSQAAIHIATNPVFHERTKHVESDCHAVRDAVQNGTLAIVHVGTDDQIADILTKALGRDQFEKLSSKLGICELHAPT